jgi:hypothetical protein
MFNVKNEGFCMEEKLIKTMDLTNGMQLNFYDGSRQLAGDRWLISLIIRMEIPVAEVSINDKGKSIETMNERGAWGKGFVRTEKGTNFCG